jgi:vacuolar protein sorting-associated protein 26
VRELDPAGELTGTKRYPFEFTNVEKPYESYNGVNVRLRYFLRVTVARSTFSANVVKEQELFVQNKEPEPEINNPIKMEVGIEDCLHIEFEYNKSKYHLRDVIIGKIYFVLVRIKIKHMEIALIKRESTGSGANLYSENETVSKFEIMDGAPVRGESIPIRMFLSGLDLVPTYRNVNNKFSLKWYLNLVLVDEEDRRYFKQQEIMLRRQTLE